ncbi:hypothetical protein [Streptomyces sp. NPDC001970]
MKPPPSGRRDVFADWLLEGEPRDRDEEKTDETALSSCERGRAP